MLSKEIFKFLDTEIIKIIQKTHIPGLCYALISGSGILHSANFGYRNISAHLPADQDTLFGIGSTTKSFTAFAILQLFNQGKVKLDDPIDIYFETPISLPNQPIRICDLLCHRSGIPDLGLAEYLLGTRLFHQQYEVSLESKSDFLTHVFGAKAFFVSPNSHFMYSNENYSLAGLIVEKVSGIAFEDYIERYIFEPLKMKRSTLKELRVCEDPNHQTSYFIDTAQHSFDPEEKPFPFHFNMLASGGIFSSINELSRYAQMLLNHGKTDNTQFLPAQLIDDAFIIHSDTDLLEAFGTKGLGSMGNEGYGYGWLIFDAFFGHKLIVHTGSTRISSSTIIICPNLNLGLVEACNAGENVKEELIGLYMALFSMALGHNPESEFTMFAEERHLQQLSGEYTDYHNFHRVVITRKGAQLYMTYKGQDLGVLYPKNQGDLFNTIFYLPTTATGREWVTFWKDARGLQHIFYSKHNFIKDYFTFGNYQGYSDPRYVDYEFISLYIPMRDGVKIAADILFPKGRQDNDRFPVLLYQTRYWRSINPTNEARTLMEHPEHQGGMVSGYFVKHGYIVVLCDVRGTGASFGYSPHMLHRAEVDDMKDIIHWITNQPWNNGYIGTFGNSYAGSTAEFAVLSHHPALKISVPRHNEFDPYCDIAFPGGVPCTEFIRIWSSQNTLLDSNRPEAMKDIANLIHGVLPVNEDKTGSLLNQAIRDHAQNIDLFKNFSQMVFRDDNFLDNRGSVLDFSIFHYKKQLEAFNIPIFSWGSWMDANTADVVIKRFLNFNIPQVGVIGTWDHTGRSEANPFYHPELNPDAPPRSLSYPQQMGEWHRAFDYYLKDEHQNGWQEKRRILYFTMGENRWKSTEQWPPKETIVKTFYLSSKFQLNCDLKNNDSEYASYKVDFAATTGTNSRWQTQLGKPMYITNWKIQEKHHLIYSMDPLTKTIEITGYPIVDVWLSTDHTDGALYAYLEMVDPTGSVFYLTEGKLRFIHRKIEDPTKLPFVVPYPSPSFRRSDALPVIPTQIIHLIFPLAPISIQIPINYTIRIAFAGHDADNFNRLPKDGFPTYRIYHSIEYSSKITLPIINEKDFLT